MPDAWITIGKTQLWYQNSPAGRSSTVKNENHTSHIWISWEAIRLKAVKNEEIGQIEKLTREISALKAAHPRSPASPWVGGGGIDTRETAPP